MKTWIMIVVSFSVWGLLAIAHALTVDEVLLLKQNGVSEKTIQMMLESENRATTNSENKSLGIQTIVRPNGRPAIIYSTGCGEKEAFDAAERLKEERAWKMLRHLIVDTR